MTNKVVLFLAVIVEMLLVYLNVIVDNHGYLFWIAHDALVLNSGNIGILLYKTVIQPRGKHV